MAPSLKSDLIKGLGTTTPAGNLIASARLRSPAQAGGQPDDHTPTEPLFLSIFDAARLLGIGEWEVKQRLRRGELLARKAGRRTLIEMASVRALAESLPAATFKPPRRVRAPASRPLKREQAGADTTA
jgi:hypothetical protein